MKKKTLYEELEVPVDADEQQIKKAYREKVKKHHPDIPGISEQAKKHFHRIALAHRILRDPEKREIYDETGGISDAPINKISLARDHLCQLLFEVIENNDLDMLKRKDILVIMSSMLNKKFSALESEVEDITAIIERLEDLAKRFSTTDDGPNFLRTAVEERARSLKVTLRNFKNTLDSLTLQKKLLKSFQFDKESLDRMVSNSVIFRFGSGTTTSTY